MSIETPKTQGLYYSIIDGTFRRRVDEKTPNAIRREYETKDGAKAEKYELLIDSLEGYIEDMGTHDGDFGRTLTITLDKNQDGVNPVINIGIETSYGDNILKKLPHIDFTKPVKLRPFARTNQTNGKEMRGIEVSQNGEKYKNFFYDGEKNINGFPEPTGDTSRYTKEDWKIHFLGVRKFLLNYFEVHVYPKMTDALLKRGSKQTEYPELPADAVPF